MTSIVDKYYRRIIQNIDNVTMTFDISTLLVKSKEHDSKINDIENDIVENLELIKDNIDDINDNKTNISSNLSDINDNETNISSNLTKIADNETNISSNLTKIGANEIKISSNLAKIGDNETNISSNLEKINSIEENHFKYLIIFLMINTILKNNHLILIKIHILIYYFKKFLNMSLIQMGN